MTWRVEFLDARALQEVEALPADMQARFLRIAELIEAMGLPAVGAPHVRHLDGKLWEMRMTGRDGIARAIYVTAKEERVVVVHTFVKKTQKTPAGALAVARARAREVE